MYVCQFQPPHSPHPPFPLWMFVYFFLYMCVCFCFANRFICTIFLDSTWMPPSFWLTSIWVMVSRSIHVSAKGAGNPKQRGSMYKWIHFAVQQKITQHCKATVKSASESAGHSVVSNSLRPHGLYSPWSSPGQNTGVRSLSLLQGIFLTRGSKPGLLHCRWILFTSWATREALIYFT